MTGRPFHDECPGRRLPSARGQSRRPALIWRTEVEPADVLSLIGMDADEVVVDPTRLDIPEVLLTETREVRQGWRI